MAQQTAAADKPQGETTPSGSSTNQANKSETKDFTKDSRIYEYGSAANPKLEPIPILIHSAELHQTGPTAIHPFDIADFLKIDGGACTSPNLLASFIRILENESISTNVNATSQAFYVIRGTGYTISPEESQKIEWSTGDMLVFPSTNGEALAHFCTSAEAYGGAAIYWIHDEPLLNYLGVQPLASNRKFDITVFKREDMLKHVEEIRHQSQNECSVAHKNRLGVLLGNAKCDQTKTLTHVLWSLLNSIPAQTVQRPHRHNSVALDLCVSAKPGVYTLMGKEIDSDGLIVDPIRCDWVPHSVFITPPGWWHSHHNESDDIAWVLPMQDAGLYTHQRTLDIRFVDDELALHASGRIRGTAFSVTNKQYTEMHALGGMEPGKARIKRVLSTECFGLTPLKNKRQRSRSIQIGKEVTET